MSALPRLGLSRGQAVSELRKEVIARPSQLFVALSFYWVGLLLEFVLIIVFLLLLLLNIHGQVVEVVKQQIQVLFMLFRHHILSLRHICLLTHLKLYLKSLVLRVSPS